MGTFAIIGIVVGDSGVLTFSFQGQKTNKIEGKEVKL